MSTPAGASTLIQEIDELVADVLGAAKKPSVTTILVVVQQIVGFIVFYGIIGTTEASTIMAIVNAAIGLGVLVVHAVQQFSAHKTANGIVQAKLDLLAGGWPTPPEPGALRGRVGGTRGE